jgi:hypothetical protein
MGPFLVKRIATGYYRDAVLMHGVYAHVCDLDHHAFPFRRMQRAGPAGAKLSAASDPFI